MKRLLIIAVLLLIGQGIFAGTGALRLVNNNTSCSVGVTVYATNTANPLGCDIMCCSITLQPWPSPGCTFTWANPTAAVVGGTGMGLCYATTAIPPSYWTSSYTDWTWTDVQFQYSNSCGSGTMNPTGVANCFVGTWSWTGGCVPPVNATWSPALGGTMVDVVVTFN